MEYKATWKFSKDGDYTIGDRVFPVPSDYINTCIGEKQELTVNRVCRDLVKEEEPDMPYDEDKYRKINDMLEEWRKGHMIEDITAGVPTRVVEIDSTMAATIFKPQDRFKIKEVIFNNPATIVYWKDGTKTVVTDMDNVTDGKAKPAESYSKETGLALCYMKKALGNKGNYNNAFREWVKED